MQRYLIFFLLLMICNTLIFADVESKEAGEEIPVCNTASVDSIKDCEIFEAIEAGEIGRVRELIKKEPELVNVKTNEYGYGICFFDYDDVNFLNREKYGIPIGDIIITSGIVENNNGWSPLHSAVKKGDKEICELLIDNGADIYAETDGGWSVLHILSIMGNKELAGYFMGVGLDVNIVDSKGYSPLHFASAFGYEELVKLFILEGADVNLKNVYGESPLHFASAAGNKEVAELLISAGADVNVMDNYGYLPVDLAVLFDNMEVGMMLVSDGSFVCNYPSFLCFAVLKNNRKLVKMIIEKGVDVNVEDNDGNTLLHLALRHNFEEIAMLLMVNGADINAKNIYGRSAVFYVRDKDLAKLLLIAGANLEVDNNGNTPLHTAVDRGDKDVVEFFLWNGLGVSTENIYGRSAVFYVRDKDLAELLLSFSARVNLEVDSDGNTPLHAAVDRRDREVVEVFLEEGLDADAVNDAGKTPLDIAVDRGYSDIAELLLEYLGKEKKAISVPEMVFILGDIFEMGDEKKHTVEVSSFYMGKYEVTYKEFCQYKHLPPFDEYYPGDDYPVTCVSWYDAINFCNWLSEREGLELCYEFDNMEEYYNPVFYIN